MEFDYSEDRMAIVTITDYTLKLNKEFSISKKIKTPASKRELFTKRDLPLLPQLKQEAINSGVAKLRDIPLLYSR